MGQKFIIRTEIVEQIREETVNFAPNFYKKFEENFYFVLGGWDFG